jgi:hypothetical protein
MGVGNSRNRNNEYQGVSRNSEVPEGYEGSKSNDTYGSGDNSNSMTGVSRNDVPPDNKDPGTSDQKGPDSKRLYDVPLGGGRKKRSRRRTKRRSHKRRSHKRRSHKRRSHKRRSRR